MGAESPRVRGPTDIALALRPPPLLAALGITPRSSFSRIHNIPTSSHPVPHNNNNNNHNNIIIPPVNRPYASYSSPESPIHPSGLSMPSFAHARVSAPPAPRASASALRLNMDAIDLDPSSSTTSLLSTLRHSRSSDGPPTPVTHAFAQNAAAAAAAAAATAAASSPGYASPASASGSPDQSHTPMPSALPDLPSLYMGRSASGSGTFSAFPSEYGTRLKTPTSPLAGSHAAAVFSYLDSPARYMASPSTFSPSTTWLSPAATNLPLMFQDASSENKQQPHARGNNTPPPILQALIPPANKRRPTPLDLVPKASAADIEQPLPTNASTASGHSTLSNDLLDLSAMRRAVQQNLRDRPLNVPFTGSETDSDCESGISMPAGYGRFSPPPPQDHLATPPPISAPASCTTPPPRLAPATPPRLAPAPTSSRLTSSTPPRLALATPPRFAPATPQSALAPPPATPTAPPVSPHALESPSPHPPPPPSLPRSPFYPTFNHLERAISPQDGLTLVRSSAQPLVIDMRPLEDYLIGHIAPSAHLSIPTLILKRLSKLVAARRGDAGWTSLGMYVSTPAGRRVWDAVDLSSHVDVVVIGVDHSEDEGSSQFASIMSTVVPTGTCHFLRGGWAATTALAHSQGVVVTGDAAPGGASTDSHHAIPEDPYRLTKSEPPSSPPRLAPAPSEIAAPTAPGKLSINPVRRNLPVLSLNPSSPKTKRPPKLCLKIDRSSSSSSKSAATPPKQSFPSIGAPTSDAPMRSPLVPVPPGGGLAAPPPRRGPSRHKPMQLTIDVGPSRVLSPPAPRSAIPLTTTGSGSNGGFGGAHHLNVRTTRGSYAGTTRHAQQHGPAGAGTDEPRALLRSGEPWSHGQSQVSPGGSSQYLSSSTPYSVPTTPGFSQANSAVSATSTPPMSEAIEVSTILPQFLYLGPEITTQADVDALQRLGIRRVLNVALECDDDEGLNLRDTFERYYRIPMKDSVEESGVSRGIRDACEFLDDARLHSAPVYVHCKAGKSRSVTVVLAYLIHANAWTLKTSYAYVAERRHGISPNIGFVAELIQFEEGELGLKQSGGVGARDDTPEPPDSESAPLVHREPKQGPRYTRESMPPDYSTNIEGGLPAGPRDEPEYGHHESLTPESAGPHRLRRTSGADIEVRKNGQWVHHRRAPVDRTTLQPGRRVSKAGLESMVMRPLERSSAPDRGNTIDGGK